MPTTPPIAPWAEVVAVEGLALVSETSSFAFVPLALLGRETWAKALDAPSIKRATATTAITDPDVLRLLTSIETHTLAEWRLALRDITPSFRVELRTASFLEQTNTNVKTNSFKLT
jgi:hypothetical protein